MGEELTAREVIAAEIVANADLSPDDAADFVFVSLRRAGYVIVRKERLVALHKTATNALNDG